MRTKHKGKGKNRAQKSGMSPYQRYDKTPFRYSAEIYACIKACREGKSGEYRRNHDAFWDRINAERRRYRDAEAA
jgi:hypothetical protein